MRCMIDRRVDAHVGVFRSTLAQQVARGAFGVDEVVVLPVSKIEARQAQRRTHGRALLGLQSPRFGRMLEDFQPGRQRHRRASSKSKEGNDSKHDSPPEGNFAQYAAFALNRYP